MAKSAKKHCMRGIRSIPRQIPYQNNNR